MPTPLRTLARIVPIAALVAMGCSDAPGPTAVDSSGEVVLVSAADEVSPAVSLDFWPFTGTRPDLAFESDPINFVFTGSADPRDIRAALMSLDGQRSPPFPAAFPFNCVWEDAMGAAQTAFAASDGWTGNAVQLQCGSYGALRFHLRLFEVAGQTIGAAHMDLLIPSTPSHQVIAWEAAEQFVVFDLARTGLLGAAPAPTPQINPAPGYREIPDVIYNGLPASLRAFIGGPPGNVASPVPIVTDGRATVITLAGALPRTAGVMEQHLELPFNQVIPRPFCSQGPTDFVLAQGLVTLTGRFHEQRNGNFSSRFSVSGMLDLTPFDVIAGVPSGETYRARIAEDHDGKIVPGGVSASRSLTQTELPQNDPAHGQLLERMHVGSGTPPIFQRREKC